MTYIFAWIDICFALRYVDKRKQITLITFVMFYFCNLQPQKHLHDCIKYTSVRKRKHTESNIRK